MGNCSHSLPFSLFQDNAKQKYIIAEILKQTSHLSTGFIVNNGDHNCALHLRNSFLSFANQTQKSQASSPCLTPVVWAMQGLSPHFLDGEAKSQRSSII